MALAVLCCACDSPCHIQVTDLGKFLQRHCPCPNRIGNCREVKGEVNFGLYLSCQALPLGTSHISTSPISTLTISTSNHPLERWKLYWAEEISLDFSSKETKKNLQFWYTCSFSFLFLAHWNERIFDIRALGIYVCTLSWIMRRLTLTGKWVMAEDPLPPPRETGEVGELT